MSAKPNQLRTLRKAAGLTQSQLAEQVGTSQQQIQRIEAGVQAARLDLGSAIAQALSVPLDKIFPGSSKRLKALSRADGSEDQNKKEKLLKQLNESGLDPDPAIWTLKVGLEGNLELILPVSSAEKDRMWTLVQSPERFGPFVLVQSAADMVALNLHRLRFCHFLFDPPIARRSRKKRKNSHAMAIHFAGTPEPFFLGIEPDDMELADALEKDEVDRAQVQHFMSELESCIDLTETLDIEDEDGETIFIQSKYVLAVQAPLEYYSPKLFNMAVEDFDEEPTEDDEDMEIL